ncbi:MAG: hypothetical protein DRP42_01425 [Tenericutes bacterium]|nr:MAG: hypothetical protein DRP42_01425 [Mycoplasmatota bacterium]
MAQAQESSDKKTADQVPGLKDYWPAFGNAEYYKEIENENRGSLAYAVFKEYGIPVKNTATGGALQYLDIKQKDSLGVVKMSLMEYSADNGGVWEFFVTPKGEIDYYQVGVHNGEIADIYHTTQTISHREACKGVMVTGEKPMITRKPAQFRPIWGDGDRTLISTKDLMIGNCVKEKFDEQATIVFTDPHLQDNKYKDGIDGLFDDFIDDPFLSIVGYVYYMKSDGTLTSPDTSIKLNDGSCTVPILISGPAASTFNSNSFPSVPLGTLKSRPIIDDKFIIHEPQCWIGLETVADYKDGIKVFNTIDGAENFPAALRFENLRDTKIDKFTAVNDVLVVGYPIAQVYPAAADKENELKADEGKGKVATKTYVVINDVSLKTIKLDSGVHYAVAIEEKADGGDLVGVEPYIVFADNSRQGDPTVYGSGPDGSGIDFYFHPRSKYYEQKNLTEATSKSKAVILPLAGNKAMLVYQIWAVVSLDAYSISITDARGRQARAEELAKSLVYSVSPLLIEDKPAPIGYASASVAGKVLDQTDRVVDGDPTTVQDFDSTEYELAMDEMRGGGVTLSLSCLNDAQVVTLAKAVYEYMNGGEVLETTYVCGPSCTPKIGGYGRSGGVVNSITYSYTDSSAYTITVTEGGRLAGAMPQVEGGLVMKQAEEVKARATVIKDIGNHIHYKVAVDGFGERLAINCCPEIIRVGDKVSVSVHNVPVEA